MKGMYDVITCIRFHQPAIIADVGNGTVSLLTGSRAKICPVLSHLFLGMNVDAWNFNIRQDILMP